MCKKVLVNLGERCGVHLLIELMILEDRELIEYFGELFSLQNTAPIGLWVIMTGPDQETV